MQIPEYSFEQIATEIGRLVSEKNKAYGDAARSSAAALALLYPDGIPPEAYADALLIVRVWDKLNRIATHRDALGENPWRDIAGYGILGVAVHDKNP